MSKLTVTQNVIRNKFQKAYTNRLENEDDLNRAMKPLITTTGFEYKTNSTTSKQQQQQHDPNTLCANLRILLASSHEFDDKARMQIKTILNELHDLEIII